MSEHWWDNPIIVERFEAKYARGAVDECWIWAGARHPFGYGELGGMTGGVRWKMRTHRMALERKLGRTLAPGEHALHDCDTPACVNPAHLSAGNARKNIHDMHARGRSVRGDQRGERHGMAKLDDDAVRKIRALLRAGASQQSVADRYLVHRRTIGRILSGKNWSHVV
jgi:hypothetical protein